jgi:membrane peptidoglycan carboxypeptidase
VKAELNAAGLSGAYEQGGLTITTTINPQVQKAAEEAGSQKSADSPMHGLSKNYQAAVIGIDPTTGEVLGYYGGDDPQGLDYGGYLSGDGKTISGGQSPGSSFKIYTLSAGLQQGLSFDSTWDSHTKKANGSPISNAGAADDDVCKGTPRNCPLETATIKSYNFPFYAISVAIGRDKVIAAAKEAGIKHLFEDGKNTPVDLTTTDGSTWKKDFQDEVGFGQYRVVPLEHAEGVATIVNNGVHHTAHFIKSVTQVNPDTGKKEPRLTENNKGNQVFPPDQMSNLQGVMKEITAADNRDLRNGREAISKSGTWEYIDPKSKNNGSGDCWFVGGIPQLAATVWVGGKTQRVALHEKNGRDMFGAGTPSKIWDMFLNSVTKALDTKQVDFPTRIKTGDPTKLGNGIAPPPTTTQDNGPCLLGVVGPGCDNNGGGTNNGGNNNGGQNNGGNNNGGNNNGGGQNNGVTILPTPGTGTNGGNGGG